MACSFWPVYIESQGISCTRHVIRSSWPQGMSATLVIAKIGATVPSETLNYQLTRGDPLNTLCHRVAIPAKTRPRNVHHNLSRFRKNIPHKPPNSVQHLAKCLGEMLTARLLNFQEVPSKPLPITPLHYSPQILLLSAHYSAQIQRP